MAKRNARSFRERKLLAEALDARALGLVTLSRACACHARGLAHVEHAASSAREALHVLVGSLGYPEEDSLTVALERARASPPSTPPVRDSKRRAPTWNARAGCYARRSGVRTNVTTRASCDASSTAVSSDALFMMDAAGAVFAKRFFAKRLTQNEICAKA